MASVESTADGGVYGSTVRTVVSRGEQYMMSSAGRTVYDVVSRGHGKWRQ